MENAITHKDKHHLFGSIETLKLSNLFTVSITDQECMPITCLPNIWKKFGINPAARFYEIYGAHIAARHGNADLTFGQVSRYKGNLMPHFMKI